MPLYTPEALPIHRALPEPKVGLHVVQGAYDSMRGILKAKAGAADLQPGSIATDPAHGIDAEKSGLIDTLNAEQKTATTASATIEHWEEAELIGAKTDDKAKVEGGIVVDAGGKRTGEFYWKDTSGAIHGPEKIGPAYTDAIRDLRRQRVDGEDKAGTYDALRNGDAVRVVFTKTDGTQDALTLRDFDTMIATEAAKRWDADTAHKIKFAELQQKHPNLAHAYARKIEDEIAKNSQYSFHHLENKANTTPKPEEKDLGKRAEYASAAAAEIENVLISDGAADLSKVRPNYSFGLLSQFNRLLQQAIAAKDIPRIEFLTPLVTSAARECLQHNPHVFDRNHSLLDNLQLNSNYYDQHSDSEPVSLTVRNILAGIGIPSQTADQIRTGLHPHRLVALISSMSENIAKDPKYVGRVINRLTTEGILNGEEGYAIETMCNHGRLGDFRKSLAGALGVKPEQLQNPEQFMQLHIDGILADAGEIRDTAGAPIPKEQTKEACKKLTAYSKEMLGKPSFAGFKILISDWISKHLGKMMMIGMALQILQAQFDKDMQASGGAGGGQPGE